MARTPERRAGWMAMVVITLAVVVVSSEVGRDEGGGEQATAVASTSGADPVTLVSDDPHTQRSSATDSTASTESGPFVEAEPTPDPRIPWFPPHGRVVDASSRPIANAEVKLSAFHGRPAETRITDERGEFSFVDLVPDGPLIPRALSVEVGNFVPRIVDLAGDRQRSEDVRGDSEILVILEVSRSVQLAIVFADGTPAGGVTVSVTPAVDRHYERLFDSPRRRAATTDASGRVEIDQLPAAGVAIVEVAVGPVNDWHRAVVDLAAMDAINPIAIPTPCTLTLELPESAAQALGMHTLSRAKAQIEVTHSNELFKERTESGSLSDSSITFENLQRGDRVVIGVASPDVVPFRLTDNVIIDTDAVVVDLSTRLDDLVAVEKRPATRRHRSSYIKWMLTDPEGQPLTYDDLGDFCLSNLEITAVQGEYTAIAEVSIAEAPRSQRGRPVAGSANFPLRVPFQVQYRAFGFSGECSILSSEDSIQIAVPPGLLVEPKRAVNFRAVGPRGAPEHIASVSVTDLRTGLRAFASGNRTHSFDVTTILLPEGVYSFRACSILGVTSGGEFAVDGSTDPFVEVRFEPDGAITGSGAPEHSSGSVLLVPRGHLARWSHRQRRAAVDSNGDFRFEDVEPGRYVAVGRYDSAAAAYQSVWVVYDNDVTCVPGRVDRISLSALVADRFVAYAARGASGEGEIIEVRKGGSLVCSMSVNADHLVLFPSGADYSLSSATSVSLEPMDISKGDWNDSIRQW